MLNKVRDRQARFLASKVGSVRRATAIPHFSDPALLTRRYASSSNSSYSSQPASTSTILARDVFLKKTPVVMLPTPLPSDVSSVEDSFYFPKSGYQETLNIIDACMFRGHDMMRARKLFDGLRMQTDGKSMGKVDISVYNQFMATYFELANASEDITARIDFVKSAWSMWHLALGDKVRPDLTTYATLLMLLTRFTPTAARGVPAESHPGTLSELLGRIISSSLSVPSTIEKLFHCFDVPKDERDSLLSQIQQWAVAEGHTSILVELGKMELTELSPDPIADIPLVNPVVKKDLGSLPWQTKKKMTEDPEDAETPFNLNALRSNMAEFTSARRHLSHDPLSRQKLIEESAVEDAKERLRHDFERMEQQGIANLALAKKKSIRKWMWEWHTELAPRLEADIKRLVQEEDQTRERIMRGVQVSEKLRVPIGPFLSLLKPHQLSLITIMEILRLHGSGGVSEGMKTARALITVGAAVEQEYSAALRKREMQRRQNLEKFYQEDSIDDTSEGLDRINARREAAKRDAEAEGSANSEWTRAIQIKVGSVLVDALMEVATVVRTTTHPKTGEPYSERQPAFNHEYEYVRGQKLGVIKLNPEVAHEFTLGGTKATLHARHLPMLVPPRPWVSHNSGAYFYNRSTAMRIKDCQEQQQYVSEASASGNLELVFSSLDVLGSTPWVINKDIFEVVLEVWNKGDELADIPPANVNLEDPPKPDDYDTNDVTRKSYLLDLKETINKRRNNHSDRCSTNYKLEIARAFLPDKFYFPHNLDFRGRAYPIPPHLNHIGDDLSRGLLKFAEKRPLGERGLRWLKIHLANVYGYDKASFDEREEWTMARLDEVRASAQDPLGEGEKMWLKADDPWQCLATCMELTEALKLEDPTLFESNLPVHQDGTCNGLQHYAALGGDSVGAQQVNLGVTDRPSDVYTFVANMVDEVVNRDAAAGVAIAQLAKGRIARKVVKQTVMTTVYGVTFIGARAQIEKQLKNNGPDLNREQLWAMSTYIARATLGSIADLFAGAQAIQTWLSSVARLIAKSIPPARVEAILSEDQNKDSSSSKHTGKPPAPLKAKRGMSARATQEQMTSVIWTTPMGLPIVQPYRQVKRKQLMTPVQSVYISDPNLQTAVNPSKQSSAFPPNFIHSLDATHMMLTALECRKAELTFASVHDSYWTHPCSVDKMSAIIRDTFIHLHSSDIMDRLMTEFRLRYAGHQVPVASLNRKEVDMINRTSKVQINVHEKKDKGKVTKSKSKPSSKASLASEMDDEDSVADAEAHEDVDEIEDSIGSDSEVTISSPSDASGSSSSSKKTKAASAYVSLVDILPPLPAKGDFSVETIKKSLYFFS